MEMNQNFSFLDLYTAFFPKKPKNRLTAPPTSFLDVFNAVDSKSPKKQADSAAYLRKIKRIEERANTHGL